MAHGVVPSRLTALRPNLFNESVLYCTEYDSSRGYRCAMAKKNGKKRAARALLASVVREMARPRLAASVGRDIGKKERPAILQSVQK